jgi:hypothetical protein
MSMASNGRLGSWTRVKPNNESTAAVKLKPISEGDFTFTVGKTDFITLCPDGRVFVRGEQVDDNKEVYAAFRQWLFDASVPPHRRKTT